MQHLSFGPGNGTALEQLRYPIGRFEAIAPLFDEQRSRLIAQIGELPTQLRAAVADLSESQLDTPYRPDGWTVRQLIHHLPDSHMNCYIRCKLAVTEDAPAITTYDEAAWAELADARRGEIITSLVLLEALHMRWTAFLRSLTASQLARGYRHPQLGLMTLDDTIQLYAWHGRHHVAQITALRARSGW
jgi:uncharacterized damage-inducible protein DinB